MAHYFETGFFVRDAAWHGLGRVLENAPSTEDALRLAELDWPVETVPAFADVDGRMVAVEDARHVIRRRMDFAPDVLGTVGARFTPLQNSEAFRWFNPLIADGDMTLEAAGSLKNGRHVWILAKLAKVAPVAVGSKAGDIVEPYLLLSNAHDGSRAVTVAFTPIRVVCWNTLSAAHSATDAAGSGAVKVRHTSGIESTLRDIRNRIDLERRNFEAKALLWGDLAHVSVGTSDDAERYVRRVFGEQTAVAAAIKAGAELPEVRAEKHVAELFRRGPGADSARNTWFGLYMAATHYADHVRGRSEDSRLASTWFGTGAELRDRAERVAVEMAAVR